MFENGDTWENYISYTKANLQLPGALIVRSSPNPIDQWSEFLKNGSAPRTADPWKHMGRYSEIFFLSSKLTRNIGSFELIPLAYLNHWQHYHPVTGRINDADTWIYGFDMQANYRHSLGVLTTGFTIRHDHQKTNYYKYRDVEIKNNRIVSTLSDNKGDLLERQDQITTLVGLFLQQSFQKGRWILDVGIRADRVKFDISGYKWGDYSFSDGNYRACPNPNIENCGSYQKEKTYSVVSPRVGLLYKVNPYISLYGAIATGANTPSSGEISSNPDLKLTKVINYETGLKVRRDKLSFDTSLYFMDVRDEVVRTIQDGITQFNNAGKTEKKGFEVSASYEVLENLSLGLSYAYSDYKFKRFSEIVKDKQSISVSRDGNRLPYIPMHQYSVFVSYRHPSGFRFNIQSDTWGKYYIDNANSEKHEGYQFITSASLGYQRKNYDLSLMVSNLFNERYANEVTKDTSGVKRYTPAPPRSFLVRLTGFGA